MVCTRYINGNQIETDLTGRFEGRTAFLVGGSPTLLQQDYKRLASRDVLSFGINNVGKTVRCTGYFFGDHPSCFFPSILHDRQALRFFNRGYERYFRDAEGKIDDENLYFFTRNNGEPSVENVSGKDMTAGNNTLSMALFSLLSFGVKRIVLCGSSFNAGAYSYGKILNDQETNWNSRLYTQQPRMLEQLAYLFGSLGVEFIDTSVVSKVSGTYRTMLLSEALDRYSEPYRDKQTSMPHCREAKLASGGKVDERISSELKTFQHYDTQAFTAVGLPSDEEERSVCCLLLLVMLRSFAETNRGRKLTVFVDCDDTDDNRLRFVFGHAKYWMRDNITFLNITEDIKSQIGENGPFRIGDLKCYLSALQPDVDCGIWLDPNVLVRQDLSFFAAEAESRISKDRFIAGARMPSKPGIIDPGVMYMVLSGMREKGYLNSLLSRLYSQDKESETSSLAINSVRRAVLDSRWNVLHSSFSGATCDYAREREIALSSYILRFDGDVKSLASAKTLDAKLLFKTLHGLVPELGKDTLGALLAFDAKGKWKTRIDKGE